jgi:hypothetical protein
LAVVGLGWCASGYGGVNPLKVPDYQLDKRFCESRSFPENFEEEKSFMSAGIQNKIFCLLTRTNFAILSKPNCKHFSVTNFLTQEVTIRVFTCSKNNTFSALQTA